MAWKQCEGEDERHNTVWSNLIFLKIKLLFLHIESCLHLSTKTRRGDNVTILQIKHFRD